MKFRPNVCMVLADEERKRVLVFQRVDVAAGPFRWQFPQGGLQPGEKPEQGLMRELREEIGTDEVTVLDRLPKTITYTFPSEIMDLLTAQNSKFSRYQGQEQHWFLGRLVNGTGAIHFRHQPPEFDRFEWVQPAEAVERVVPFKREAYRQALSGFGLLPATS